MNLLRIKRIYDPPSEEDGKRILVDRLWPRGVSREKAKVDIWLKEIAPSQELRKWYCHIPEKHEEFRNLYELELSNDSVHTNAVELVKNTLSQENITLLYAAKSPVFNHAIILYNFLRDSYFLTQDHE